MVEGDSKVTHILTVQLFASYEDLQPEAVKDFILSRLKFPEWAIKVYEVKILKEVIVKCSS